jgi:hypothetical protein
MIFLLGIKAVGDRLTTVSATLFNLFVPTLLVNILIDTVTACLPIYAQDFAYVV